MKDNPREFAIRKDRRDLQPLRRLLESPFKMALLVTALGLYWRWNHGYPGIGPIFLSERKPVTGNAKYCAYIWTVGECCAHRGRALDAWCGATIGLCASPEHNQGLGCSDGDRRTPDIAIAFDVTDLYSLLNSVT
jgi:hypothetical protein